MPKSDSAMKGGIDFQADKIKIYENGNLGDSFLDLSKLNLPNLDNLTGFTPIIINIVPVTKIPELLGL